MPQDVYMNAHYQPLPEGCLDIEENSNKIVSTGTACLYDKTLQPSLLERLRILFTKRRKIVPSYALYALLILSWAITLLESGILIYQNTLKGADNPIFPQMLYSLVQDLLKYEIKVFTSGLDNDSDPRFQGHTSPDLDKAWDSLYNFGSIKLNAWEAAHIPNKTWPLLQEPGSYVANLQVFHDLHCLNMIRKSLHPDYYKGDHWSDQLMEDSLLGPRHAAHCIESIRHALMCMSDVSVMVWQWDDFEKRVKAIPSNARTCRNFEVIHDWALQRKTDPRFDRLTFVANDPLAGIYDRRILNYVTD
ncbi:hypothetical protein F5884DRAFT_793359 [Xylogone sp. PMI_703]|nr:hypothetical protein F5884DRAFT_793359 [Xylogone sp. PMI_703]